MFTKKDKIRAESLIFQHPWISDNDFFDFIGYGGSHFMLNQGNLRYESKRMFFCKMLLEEGRLYIISRFFAGNCDERFEVLEYSPIRIVLKKDEDEIPITYHKFTEMGPMTKDLV